MGLHRLRICSGDAFSQVMGLGFSFEGFGFGVKVKDRPAVGDGAELLARGGDAQLRVSSVPQLLLYSLWGLVNSLIIFTMGLSKFPN